MPRPIGADEFRDGMGHTRPARTEGIAKRAKCHFALQTSRRTATSHGGHTKEGEVPLRPTNYFVRTARDTLSLPRFG